MTAIFLRPGQVPGQNDVPNVMGMVPAAQPGNPYTGGPAQPLTGTAITNAPAAQSPAAVASSALPATPAQGAQPPLQNTVDPQQVQSMPMSADPQQAPSATTPVPYGQGHDMSLLGQGQPFSGNAAGIFGS